MSSPGRISDRATETLRERESAGLLRRLEARPADAPWLNLADNDYLGLAHDPAVVAAAAEAAKKWGASAGASPLVTGYTELHAELERAVAGWHGYQHGLLWNSGFAANSAVLGLLPRRGDVVLADRLIHASMIAGILRSGARLRRFPHNDLHALQAMLAEEAARQSPTRHVPQHRTALNQADAESGAPGAIFVVTESVYSMDGDSPDLAALAQLHEEFEFFWVLDEAHATGWFGETGAGALEAQGCPGQPDVRVSTLGKALGSQGAYTLYRDGALREWLLNEAGEFVYSTYLAPPAVGAALAALQRIREICSQRTDPPLAPPGRGTGGSGPHAAGDIQQPPAPSDALPSSEGSGVGSTGQPSAFTPLELSRSWRAAMREAGANVPDGDSPIVPVRLGSAERAMKLQRGLLERGFRVSCIRPPTVPEGTARLRVSLRRGLTDVQRVAFAAALKEALACA
jgi:7-keto-8-aminopelargonate synthetase-like enzyme